MVKHHTLAVTQFIYKLKGTFLANKVMGIRSKMHQVKPLDCLSTRPAQKYMIYICQVSGKYSSFKLGTSLAVDKVFITYHSILLYTCPSQSQPGRTTYLPEPD